MLDLAERHLQEARCRALEGGHVAGAEEAVVAFVLAQVVELARAQRVLDLAVRARRRS